MHPSSLANMQRCVERWCTADWLPRARKAVVLDIGAVDVNGSFAQLFDPARFEYVGIDMVPGKGVDVVLDSPYTFPFPDGHADLVISGQMLEHNKFFWRTFAEKMRVLNETGFCFMIVPSRGEIHRYPVDCYRFYPDAYAALAEYTDSMLIDCWLDADSKWGDLTGVFVKTPRPGLSPFDTGAITSLGTGRRRRGLLGRLSGRRSG